MDSAYKAPLASCRLERRERKVLAYWMIALLLLSCALLVSFPGLVLLNQELRWIPTDGWISEVRYGQTPVPLRTAMRDSLLSAFVIGLTGRCLRFVVSEILDGTQVAFQTFQARVPVL